MSHLTRLNHPYPTTIYRIVGDADDVLAFHKFSVFAFVSVFTSNAASAFGTTLRNERKRNKRHARFVKSYYQKRRREFDQFGKGERALERLLDMVEDRLFFLHQPRTVNTIPDTRPPFNPPCWTGDSADGFVAVPLPESSVLSLEEARRFACELGYDAHAALASIPRLPWMNAKPDRRRLGVVETEDGQWLDRTTIAQPLPYVAATTRRSTQGFFSRDSVLKALASMRSSHKMRMATFQVVFSHQSPTQVSEEFGVGLDALKKAATRARGRIQGTRWLERKPNVYAASERDASTLWRKGERGD